MNNDINFLQLQVAFHETNHFAALADSKFIIRDEFLEGSSFSRDNDLRLNFFRDKSFSCLLENNLCSAATDFHFLRDIQSNIIRLNTHIHIHVRSMMTVRGSRCLTGETNVA